LFEYAVIGLPTICSNLTATNEMINRYQTGIAINPNDEKEFIDAYKTIKENYDDYILNETDRQSLLWNNNLNEIINE